MGKPTFSCIFGNCLEDSLMSLIGDKAIEKCNLDIESRSLSVEISCDTYIQRELQLKTVNSTK